MSTDPRTHDQRRRKASLLFKALTACGSVYQFFLSTPWSARIAIGVVSVVFILVPSDRIWSGISNLSSIWRDRLRSGHRLALLVALGHLVGFALLAGLAREGHEATSYRLVVARLDGPEDEYAVAPFLTSAAESVAARFGSIEVVPVDVAINQSNGGSASARDLAEKHGAQGAIWGWYAANADSVFLVLNYEDLTDERESDRVWTLRKTEVQAMKGFRLQQQLSSAVLQALLLSGGVNAFRAGDFESSRSLLDGLSKYEHGVDAHRASGLMSLGTVHHQAGDYEAADSLYTASILLNPDYAKAYTNRGTTRNSLGRYTDALRDFERSILLDPLDTRAYANAAHAMERLGDYRGALDYLTRAIEVDSTDIYLLRSRARFRVRLLHDGAEDDIERALALDAKDPLTRHLWAARLLELGSETEAEATLLSILASTRSHYDAALTLGHLNFGRGRYARALDNYSHAVTLGYDRYESAFLVARCLNAMDRHATAIRRLEAVFEQYPTNYAVLTLLIDSFQHLGRANEAPTVFDQRIAKEPDFKYWWLGRSNLYAILGDFDRAIRDANMAIVLDSSDASAWEHRGRLRQAIGDSLNQARGRQDIEVGSALRQNRR